METSFTATLTLNLHHFLHMQGVNDGDTIMKAKYEFIPEDYGEMRLKEGQVGM